MRFLAATALAAGAVLSLVASTSPVTFDPALFVELRWRSIGPFRAGRAIGVAGHADRPNVVFMATPYGGVWKTDDYGRTWQPVFDGQATGAIQGLRIDLDNAGRVVVATALGSHVSEDEGRTWTLGPAREGDAVLEATWTSRRLPQVIAVADEGGAAVTVNGGRTWSSRLNQPTGEFDHVSVDSAFPYRVCGPQRGRGAVCVASRGDTGRITARDWAPLPLSDGAYVVPNPQDADVVFGGMPPGRLDRQTGQATPVPFPSGGDDRFFRPAPIAAAPMESGAIYAATSVVWKSTNDGQTWSAIGPAGIPSMAGRSAISAFEPSPVDRLLLWAGTGDDRLLLLTRDGGRTWEDVSPSRLGTAGAIGRIEASHFDRNTAYITLVAADPAGHPPQVYRTRDGGTTWLPIAAGLPAGAIHAVREDALRRGLLFAGTDTGVFVSFDDGEMWQSLRLNLPPVPVRELAIKDSDLIAATGGRGFWVLNDISPLRQITPDLTAAPAYLLRPPPAWRMGANFSGPADAGEPSSDNPPDGVVLSYLIGPDTTGPVTIEVVEPVTGEVVRRESVQASRGLHRFVWDVRYAPPASPAVARGMFVTPGTYQVRLSAGDRTYRQALTVRLDPRVAVSAADLAAQHATARLLHDAIGQLSAARRDVDREIQTRPAAERPPLDARRTAIDAALEPLPHLFIRIVSADARPTTALDRAVAAALERARDALLRSGQFQF